MAGSCPGWRPWVGDFCSRDDASMGLARMTGNCFKPILTARSQHAAVYTWFSWGRDGLWKSTSMDLQVLLKAFHLPQLQSQSLWQQDQVIRKDGWETAYPQHFNYLPSDLIPISKAKLCRWKQSGKLIWSHNGLDRFESVIWISFGAKYFHSIFLSDVNANWSAPPNQHRRNTNRLGAEACNI